MNAAAYEGPKHAEVKEVSSPGIERPTDVLVQIRTTEPAMAA